MGMRVHVFSLWQPDMLLEREGNYWPWDARTSLALL
jgi:hypothetical protein